MGITKRDLDQAFAEHKPRYGGAREDYFALLHVMREFEKTHDQVGHQVAFGSDTTHGLHAFHVDINRRNLYLFQFQWSEQPQSFKEPLKRLAHDGMERIFGPPAEQPDPLLSEVRNRLHEDQAVIDRVLVNLVFNGSPEDAEQSATLDALREDLESKKYLIDRVFPGRSVPLTIQFISNETRGRVGGHISNTHVYDLDMPGSIVSAATTGEQLHVGFVSLFDLYKMHRDMGQRLFERNIRAGLDPDRPVNRKIRAALEDIAVGKAPASAFVFNHNGVTISAQELEVAGPKARITEPRVLNGAQTISSATKFIETIDPENTEQLDRLKDVRVLAKIVSRSLAPFITDVTINTNRQNPVDPANLRASDFMQLELQDKFKRDLGGIFYARQERSFESFSEDDLRAQGYDENQNHAIEMKRLARTFLAAQGEVDRMSRLNDVFETEAQYRACFAERYLKSDARRILLAYKVQFRLGRVIREIEEKGSGYSYVPRAKNLLWALLIQGLLNHPKCAALCEAHGTTLTKESEFTEEIKTLGAGRIRLVMRETLADPRYKEQVDAGRLFFLRTKAVYTRCMEVAEDKYGWKKQLL